MSIYTNMIKLIYAYWVSMSNSSMQDIITLLYTHKTIVTSDGVHTSQGKALHEIIKRCYRNIEYYKDNELITATFDFLKKVIDNFFKIWYTIIHKEKMLYIFAERGRNISLYFFIIQAAGSLLAAFVLFNL